MKVRILNEGIKELGSAEDVAEALGDVAEDVQGRVRLPSRASLELSRRWGVGPRGAFSQVMMRGPGAIAIEFGSTRRAPLAPLRRAVRSK